jgi:hypothetical protein
MSDENPTEQELAAVINEFRRWRVDRFVDRANRQVLKLHPPEGDVIHQPVELRLSQRA